MHVLNKRTLVVVGLAVVAAGMLRKYSKDPSNKDSFITKLADSIGLSA
jgi:hypothetical protein